MIDNLALELKKIRKDRNLRRRRRHRKSVMDPFRGEIMILAEHGASLSETCEWLKNNGVFVGRSTVWHFLNKINARHKL